MLKLDRPPIRPAISVAVTRILEKFRGLSFAWLNSRDDVQGYRRRRHLVRTLYYILRRNNAADSYKNGQAIDWRRQIVRFAAFKLFTCPPVDPFGSKR